MREETLPLPPLPAAGPAAGWPAGQGRLAWGAALVFVALACLLPTARLLAELVAALAGEQRAAVLQVLAAPATRTATLHSLEVGIGGTLLAVLYGTGVATAVTLVQLRWRAWIVFGFVMQAMLPPQVVALAWMQIWLPVRDGLVSLGWSGAFAIGNPLQSRGGIILLLGIHYAPLVFLAVRAGLMNLPAELVEAARVGGARPGTVLRRIVWPLLTPAIGAGAALAFVSCIGNFGIPAFLGIPADYLVLPTLIYRELSGFGPAALPSALALSMLTMVLAGAGVALQQAASAADRYRMVAAHPPGPMFHLGRWQRTTERALALAVGLLLVLPLLALVAKSLSPAPGVPLTWDSASLQHYAYVLAGSESTLRAIVNSIGLAFGAAAVLAVAALLLAHELEVRRRRVLRALLPWVELPYVVPGVVLAVGFILLYLHPLPGLGISLYNTVWIIFLAYLARFLTLQLRTACAGLRQLPPEMLEAAQVFGAGYRRRLLRIVLPLLLPSLAAGGLLVVLLAMNELTVSALLWSTGAETLGVVVFSLEQGGETSAASALGVLAVALTVAMMAAASWLGRDLPPGVLPWRASN